MTFKNEVLKCVKFGAFLYSSTYMVLKHQKFSYQLNFQGHD